MNKKSGSGSALFLMEMIMVVFFFILCASTCITVFVRANSMSRLASDTNKGVVKAESIAETWKGGRFEEYLAGMKGQVMEDGSSRIGWNENWEPVRDEQERSYEAVVTVQEDGLMAEAEIVITRVRDKRELYRLSAKKFNGEMGG